MSYCDGCATRDKHVDALRSELATAHAARRDQFAAAALTAVIANDTEDVLTADASAALAVRYADALLAALDGTEEK